MKEPAKEQLAEMKRLVERKRLANTRGFDVPETIWEEGETDIKSGYFSREFDESISSINEELYEVHQHTVDMSWVDKFEEFFLLLNDFFLLELKTLYFCYIFKVLRF